MCPADSKYKTRNVNEIKKSDGLNLGSGPIKYEIWDLLKVGKQQEGLNRSIDVISAENYKVEEVQVSENWEKIPVKLDSGAIDWVFTPETAQAFPIEPTRASKAGINYIAANGSKIGNFGQRKIKGFSDENVPLNVAAQVAGVKSNLGSVFRMCPAGNKVVFDEDGSYILNKKTGKKIKVRMEMGILNLTCG